MGFNSGFKGLMYCRRTLWLYSWSAVSAQWLYHCLDVRGSVHHSTIHKENPTIYNNISKFYYSIFICSSTCFGRHTAHHQEPKTALATSGFSYVKGCWMLSGTVPDNVHHLHVHQPSTYEKPEAASAVLGSWWWAVCRPKHVELHINKE